MWVLLLITALQVFEMASAEPQYLIGTGLSDITGPAADVNMMGYAMLDQIVSGIATRLYARAFIFADRQNENNRFVFINMDACMAAQGVTQEVFRRLKDKYGDLYTEQNTALSGTHTHSGPGGYLTYTTYQVTSLGFVRQSFDALVEGVLEAIDMAHERVAPADLFVNQGKLVNASVNRSPTAWANNPAEERARYPDHTDKDMTLLKVVGANGLASAAINWFAVHCTSVSNQNQLINGDSKGVAAHLMEAWAAVGGSGTGTAHGFISAFAQASVGDTSPNTLGAFCNDTGLPCDLATSTCNGRNAQCMGRGPAWPNDEESNLIIAQLQADKATELFEGATERVTGPIQYGHMYVHMDYMEVQESEFTRAGTTCPPAMGFSFAAGTTDGPGAFDFKQGDTKGTAFWKVVRSFITEPSAKLQQCQAPKPILLATGEMDYPYPWQPHVVDISILKVGQVVILCVPGEFTTMAGHRLKDAVRDKVRSAWGDNLHFVIGGLTNTYSSYVTTYEEYKMQRYEGASTLYGPHTLDGYIQEFRKLAEHLVTGTPVPATQPPPNLLPRQWSLLPPVEMDAAPFGLSFGATVRDVSFGGYEAGSLVEVVFQSACPRNNIRRNGTFLAVDRLDEASGTWLTVATDRDLSTKFIWGRPFHLSPESTATIRWAIPGDAPPGMYRIRHFGTWKRLGGRMGEFAGASSPFRVARPGTLTPPVRGSKLARAVSGVLERLLGGRMRLWSG